MRLLETVEIELDRKRYMVFDHEALRLAERELNKFRGVQPAVWAGIDEYVGMANIRRTLVGVYPADFTQIMLWAGLHREDADLAIETAGALITDRNYVSDKIFEALEKCWPAKTPADQSDNSEAVKKKADQPTGSDTGASAASSSH